MLYNEFIYNEISLQFDDYNETSVDPCIYMHGPSRTEPVNPKDGVRELMKNGNGAANWVGLQ